MQKSAQPKDRFFLILNASPLVSVIIVTWNSAQEIAACLNSVFNQDYPALEIIVVDNGSNDETQKILTAYANQIRSIFNGVNEGYAKANNIGISVAKGDFVLTLNADARLEPACIKSLVDAVQNDAGIGSASGKILKTAYPSIIDSTGISFDSKDGFPCDRGEGEPDVGRYDRVEEVFGVTGAAGFFRRNMLEDIRLDQEYFDEDFFAYYEDVDLAWRARLRGWKCLYVPQALIYHDRRGPFAQPPHILRHFFKNRYLLFLKNGNIRSLFTAFSFNILKEPFWFAMMLVHFPHLWGAMMQMIQLFPKMLKKRDLIQKSIGSTRLKKID